MKKTLARFQRHLNAIRSTLKYSWGNITKSEKHLQAARRIDPENFKAVRNIMRLEARSRQNIDRLYSAINLIADCKPEAEPVILSLLSESESQLSQDIFCVLANNQKKNGTFVEVGVGTGTSISNTWLLEKRYGWTGLLIEPCRTFHSPIRKNRKAVLDVRAASSRASGTIEFHEATDNGEYSFAENAIGHRGSTASSKATSTYLVETTTLNQIFADHKIPKKIDFLSLDTEGSELDILTGLDFKSYEISVMCIEHNHRVDDLARLDILLLPLGYQRVLPTTSAYDAWYVHKSLVSHYFFPKQAER